MPLPLQRKEKRGYRLIIGVYEKKKRDVFPVTVPELRLEPAIKTWSTSAKCKKKMTQTSGSLAATEAVPM